MVLVNKVGSFINYSMMFKMVFMWMLEHMIQFMLQIH